MSTSGHDSLPSDTEHPSSHRKDAMRHREAFRQHRAFVESIVGLIEIDLFQSQEEVRQ